MFIYESNETISAEVDYRDMPIEFEHNEYSLKDVIVSQTVAKRAPIAAQRNTWLEV